MGGAAPFWTAAGIGRAASALIISVACGRRMASAPLSTVAGTPETRPVRPRDKRTAGNLGIGSDRAARYPRSLADRSRAAPVRRRIAGPGRGRRDGRISITPPLRQPPRGRSGRVRITPARRQAGRSRRFARVVPTRRQTVRGHRLSGRSARLRAVAQARSRGPARRQRGDRRRRRASRWRGGCGRRCAGRGRTPSRRHPHRSLHRCHLGVVRRHDVMVRQPRVIHAAESPNPRSVDSPGSARARASLSMCLPIGFRLLPEREASPGNPVPRVPKREFIPNPRRVVRQPPLLVSPRVRNLLLLHPDPLLVESRPLLQLRPRLIRPRQKLLGRLLLGPVQPRPGQMPWPIFSKAYGLRPPMTPAPMSVNSCQGLTPGVWWSSGVGVEAATGTPDTCCWP